MPTLVTPHPTPAGGFPLVLNSQLRDGGVAQAAFPSAAAVDVTRHNQCLNPKFGASVTTNWTNGGLATFAAGNLSLNQGLPAGVTTGLHCVGTGGGQTATCNSLSVTNAVPAFFSVSVYIVSSDGPGINLRIRNSAGANKVVGPDAGLPVAGGRFTRIALGVVPDATDANYKCDVGQLGNGNIDFWFTCCIMEVSPVFKPYFDGGSADIETTWDGAAELSASTKTNAAAADTFKAMRVLTAAGTLAAAAT